MAFIDDFNAIELMEGKICITWIGQAGFLIKTARKVIAIDPYLTDSVYELFKADYGYGFKRLTPALFKPTELTVDYLFSSHEHGDHMDVEAIFPMTDNSITKLYANRESTEVAIEKGVPLWKIETIEKGDQIQLDEIKVTVLCADHGELSPNAMGFLFDFGFAKIYYSGDTAYNKNILQQAIDSQPDIALLPINGAFGNLDAREAALFANDLKAKICIPHHFWTFPMHLGNPQQAIELFPQLAPSCKLVMQTPGETLFYPE